MSNSFKTFLKHTAKDFHNQSVNPPVVRASTIIFKSMKDIRNRSLKYVNCESKQFYVLPEKFGGGMTKIVRYMESNGCWSENWYCEYKHCVPCKDFPNEHSRLVKDALRHMISAKHLKKWQLPFHCNSCDGRWAWDHHMGRHSCANMKLKKISWFKKEESK